MKKKRKLGRKLLAFLLTLAMVVELLPGMSLTVYAADGDTSIVHTHDSITFNAWNSTTSLPTSGNYYLTGNVTVSSITTISNTLNLCLNGYGILMNGNDSVFYVNSGATMNLYDCNGSNKTHYITAIELVRFCRQRYRLSI